jgi:hypothetical protein
VEGGIRQPKPATGGKAHPPSREQAHPAGKEAVRAECVFPAEHCGRQSCTATSGMVLVSCLSVSLSCARLAPPGNARLKRHCFHLRQKSKTRMPHPSLRAQHQYSPSALTRICKAGQVLPPRGKLKINEYGMIRILFINHSMNTRLSDQSQARQWITERVHPSFRRSRTAIFRFRHCGLYATNASPVRSTPAATAVTVVSGDNSLARYSRQPFKPLRPSACPFSTAQAPD